MIVDLTLYHARETDIVDASRLHNNHIRCGRAANIISPLISLLKPSTNSALV